MLSGVSKGTGVSGSGSISFEVSTIGGTSVQQVSQTSNALAALMEQFGTDLSLPLIVEEIAALQSNGAVAALTVRVDTLETEMVTAQSNIGTAQSNISSLQTSVSTNSSDISTLQMNVSSNTADIGTLQSSMTQAQTDIAAINTDITQIVQAIQDIGTDLNTLNTNIGAVSTDLTTTNSNLSALDARVTTTEATLVTDGTALISLDTRVTALESGGGGGASDHIQNTGAHTTVTTTSGNTVDMKINDFTQVSLSGDIDGNCNFYVDGAGFNFDAGGAAQFNLHNDVVLTAQNTISSIKIDNASGAVQLKPNGVSYNFSQVELALPPSIELSFSGGARIGTVDGTYINFDVGGLPKLGIQDAILYAMGALKAQGFQSSSASTIPNDELVTWGFLKSFIDVILPIGCLQLSANAAPPNTFGGYITWTVYAAANSRYLKGTTGASAGTTASGSVLNHFHNAGTYQSATVNTGNNTVFTITDAVSMTSGATVNFSGVGNTNASPLNTHYAAPSVLFSTHTHSVPGAAIVGTSAANTAGTGTNECNNVLVLIY